MQKGIAPDAGSAELRKIFEELISDCEAFLTKAETGIKGKIGSPSVRQFIREVKSKLKNMASGIKDPELKEKAEAIVSRITKLEEGALSGSFEDITDKVRTAVRASTWFPEKIGEKYQSGPYIRYMFPDRAIVDYNAKLYEVAFAFVNDVIVLGQPKEVLETYVVKEAETFGAVEIEMTEAEKSAAQSRHGAVKAQKTGDIKENGGHEIRPNMEFDGYISLREAKYDAAKGEIIAILIEAGTNLGKRRHYPKATVEESAPLFRGLKMYINHPTKAEEAARPERDLRDYVATITETWADNGKAIGKISVHDKWLKELLADPVARENVGLSINAKGKSYVGKIDGKDMQIIEKICEPKSVDWVTEPGARGRVVQLFESHMRGGVRKMEMETVTLQELKEARPDLYEAAVREGKKTPDANVLKEAVDSAVAAAVKPFQDKEKLRAQKDLVGKWLQPLKIHEAGKKRCLTVADTIFETEAKLKEAFDARIKEESEYISSINGKKGIKGLGDGGAEGEGVLKEAQDALNDRAGFKKEEKEKSDK
jgi:hypothetical protein